MYIRIRYKYVLRILMQRPLHHYRIILTMYNTSIGYRYIFLEELLLIYGFWISKYITYSMKDLDHRHRL